MDIKKINMLYDKDNEIGYENLLKLEKLSLETNEVYQYIDEFIKMLDNEKTFIRVRGFRLICIQAKWDKENKINNNIEKVLLELDDEKPTAVRQCLASLKYLLIYKKELLTDIKNKLEKIDRKSVV